MGTNYWYAWDQCTCCRRYEKVHMCKNLTNWKAYLDGTEEARILDRAVSSWKHWKDLLLAPGALVATDDGREYYPIDFIQKVEALTDREKDRPYQVRLEYSPITWNGPEPFWQDIDGFYFQTNEFR